jgi:rhodanese-related sulfurtransferase
MKPAFIISAILLFACIETAGQTSDSVKYINLEPYDFHLNYLRDDTAMLIDVREFFEYKRSRIKDAVLISSSGNLDFAADTLDKNLALFLYCTTDYRSLRVAAKFAEKGFRKVYNLEGGIKAWRKDGFPMERHRLKGSKAQWRGGRKSGT